jgi:hypothetical protein
VTFLIIYVFSTVHFEFTQRVGHYGHRSRIVLKLPSTAVRYRDVPPCHLDDSWPAKQIHIFRVAVGLSLIMVGDGGARIGPKILP